MKKRELIQAIERMPHEAEVEIPMDCEEIDQEKHTFTEYRGWQGISKAEYVDGKIRLS